MAIHKVQVRSKPGSEDKLSQGSTTQVLLDGKVLSGARFIKFEVDSRKMAKVTIELYANIELDASLDLELVKTEKISDKLEVRTLKSKS